MNTFDFTEEEIINCIIEVANSITGETQEKILKILIDFMQFKNCTKDTNIFLKEFKKNEQI